MPSGDMRNLIKGVILSTDVTLERAEEVTQAIMEVVDWYRPEQSKFLPGDMRHEDDERIRREAAKPNTRQGWGQ